MDTLTLNGKKDITPTVVLLILDILYLALVSVPLIGGMDLAAHKAMQYALHITVIVSALAIFFFVDRVYAAEEDKRNGGLARIFAALFTLPILIARGIGLAAISDNSLYAADSLFNFYAASSIIRPIELMAWTTFFPFTMLFLSKVFFKAKKAGALAWLCLLSALCCFIAFMTILSPHMLFLFIGILGWGILFIPILILYLLRQIKGNKT